MNDRVLPVSVVVPTKNSIDHLEDCLSSVTENFPSELIVVDGDSTDDTIKIAKKFTSNIFSDKGFGISGARFIGSRQAKEKFIAFVDSDVLLPPNALNVMLREIQTSNYAVIMSPYFKVLRASTYWSNADVRHIMYSHCLIKGTRLATFCALFRKEVLLQYGFEFSYGGFMDDKDLGLRLLKGGQLIGYSQVIPVHMKKQDLCAFALNSIHLGRLKTAYFKKYGFRELRNFPIVEGIFWSLYSVARGLFDMLPFFFVRSFYETKGFLQGPPKTDVIRPQ